MEPKVNRIASLDGLRAISILLVIWCHAMGTVNYPRWLFAGPATFVNGTLAVRIFFVISGYLITTLLLREEARFGSISLPGFYKRRALRILPVYYLYIIVVAVFFGFLGLRAIHTSTFVASFTFTTRLWAPWGGATWPLQHTWSLAIEEQFYLMWPALLVFLGADIGRRIWVPALILMAPMLRFLSKDKVIVDLIFPMQGDAIAFGCLLALSFSRQPAQFQRIFEWHPHWCRLGAFVLIYLQRFVVVPLGWLHYDTAGIETWFTVIWPTLQCVGIAYLVGSFVTVHKGVTFKLLNIEPVQWIGRLSYSLYIWQQLFVPQREFRLVPADWVFAKWIGSFPQNIVAIFVVASLSYYCLEKPFLSLKDRLRIEHKPKENRTPTPSAIQSAA